MTWYDRIRKRRIELNISQQELAETLGYRSRSSVNKIEQGLNDIPVSKIVGFAKALKCSPLYLMGWENSPAETYRGGMSNNSLRSDEEHLLTNYNKLNSTGKDKSQEYVKDLTENDKYTAPPELKTKLNA